MLLRFTLLDMPPTDTISARCIVYLRYGRTLARDEMSVHTHPFSVFVRRPSGEEVMSSYVSKSISVSHGRRRGYVDNVFLTSSTPVLAELNTHRFIYWLLDRR